MLTELGWLNWVDCCSLNAAVLDVSVFVLETKRWCCWNINRPSDPTGNASGGPKNRWHEVLQIQAMRWQYFCHSYLNKIQLVYQRWCSWKLMKAHESSWLKCPHCPWGGEPECSAGPLLWKLRQLPGGESNPTCPADGLVAGCSIAGIVGRGVGHRSVRWKDPCGAHRRAWAGEHGPP